MQYILRTADSKSHISTKRRLASATLTEPMLFASADHAIRMTQTQPDFSELVVDVAAQPVGSANA